MNNAARWKEWSRWWHDLRPQFYKCLDNRHLIACIDYEMREIGEGSKCQSTIAKNRFIKAAEKLLNDKPNNKGVRLQKVQYVGNYKAEVMTITIERGDKLNE
jgi:hypothetical protein